MLSSPKTRGNSERPQWREWLLVWLPPTPATLGSRPLCWGDGKTGAGDGGEGMAEKVPPGPILPVVLLHRCELSAVRNGGALHQLHWWVQGCGESGPLCLIKLEKREDSAGGIEGKH